VVLLDGNNPMATTYLTGIGVGPLSVATAGEIETIAGDGIVVGQAFPVTGAQATSTAVSEPLGVAVDGSGNIYYTDKGYNLIGEVNSAGTLTVIAGIGSAGFSPDGTVATSAALSAPSAILIDGAGNIFFADSGNSAVREVVKLTGRIVTVAGTGVAGYWGDGSAATQAKLNQPEGIAFDSSGNLYISDTGNSVIRRVSAADGTISTVAGTGMPGFSGDGQPAAAAQLNSPYGIAFGSDGSLYIADFLNNRVRKVDTSNFMSTVAGTGDAGYLGDEGAALNAEMHNPASVAVDAAGDIFIADSENNVVRKVNVATQIMTTLAGNGTPVSCCDGLDADNGQPGMEKVYAVAVDGSGNLYIADRFGLRVREVYGAVGRFQFKDIKKTNTSPPQIQRIDNDGNAPLHLSVPVSVIAVGATVINSAVDPSTTTCSTGAMAPGAECNIGVEFKPMETGTPAYGQINVNSDSANTPVVIDLFGNSLNIEPTTTTLTSDVNPSAFGQSVTFTATISSLYTGTLTGTVQLIDTSNGNALIGSAAPVNSSTRKATVSVSNLALGVHQIIAVFTDSDTNNTNSTSLPYKQTVVQAAVLALTSSLNPAQVYENVTFTATISETPAGGIAPTGVIVFSDSLPGGPLSGTGTPVPLNNGSASFSTTLLAAGSHPITATYAGDTNNSATLNTLTEKVNTATTTTTLTTSNPSVPLTAPVTFTATVAGNNSSTPTGTFTFYDGQKQLGQPQPVSNSGSASLSASFVTTGVHSITVSYSGDSDYATSSAGLTETVNKIATSTAVVSSANPANAGATVNFTVTVTAASSTTPNVPITGTVSLIDGSMVIGTGTLAALGTGPATASLVIPVTSLGIGSHAITAVYAGDTNYVGSTSGGVSETVGLATSSTVLTASTTSAIATNPVTLTATLSSNGGTPTGTVKFMDGATAIGTGNLVNGIASMTTATLAVGTHTITAVYGGDGKDTASASNTVGITVVARTTSVALTSSQNPLLTLAPVTITATVATGNGPAPTGTITFSQDGAVVSTSPVGATGTATLQLPSLPVGTHSFVATYSGDAVDLASISTPLSELVQLRGTTDVLTTSATSLTGGQQITLISVVRWTGSATPTGSVTFFTGSDSLATVAVDSTGVATVTVLLSGTSANLSSTYNGDQNYAGSTSATELVTIGPAPDFEIAATPPTFTLVSKQHMILTLTITSMKDFTDTLSLGCLGLPQAATCNFSNDQMLLGAGNAQSVTLTVDTGDPLLAGTQAKNESAPSLKSTASKLVMACFLPGGLLLGLLGTRLRRVKGFSGLVMLLLLAGLSTVVIGCGTVNAIGTPAGTYQFRVSATGKTGIQETLPITMTVTQ
jgi:sugar lactone lactonase YvrE